jgi:hypothetical protein
MGATHGLDGCDTDKAGRVQRKPRMGATNLSRQCTSRVHSRSSGYLKAFRPVAWLSGRSSGLSGRPRARG